MIICHVCNTENIDGAAFCSECGTSFAPAPQAGPVYPAAPAYPMAFGLPIKQGDPSKAWAAILGLVLGILSVPCCFGGLMFFMDPYNFNTLYTGPAISGIIALAGLIFSIIGIKSTKKGLAIGGLVCAIVGLLLAGLFAGIISTDIYRETFDEMMRTMY